MISSDARRNKDWAVNLLMILYNQTGKGTFWRHWALPGCW